MPDHQHPTPAKPPAEHPEGPGSAIIPIAIVLLLTALTWAFIYWLHVKYPTGVLLE